MQNAFIIIVFRTNFFINKSLSQIVLISKKPFEDQLSSAQLITESSLTDIQMITIFIPKKKMVVVVMVYKTCKIYKKKIFVT